MGFTQADLEADLATAFRDSTSVLTATPPGEGATPVVGPCDFYESDEVKEEATDYGGNIMHLCRVIVRTATFGFLKGDAACSVDGRNFTVWKRLEEGDGRVTQILLREVE